MNIGEGDVPAKNPAPLLEVVELCTTFQTPAGSLRAVDGVSFTLERGRTLGIVGESGSGKTVLSRSIMGLLPARGVERSGRVLYHGRDLVSATERDLSRIWGAEIAIVLQDPMTSLSPVKRIGAQMTDGIRHHLGVSRTQAKAMALTLLASVGLSDPPRRFGKSLPALGGYAAASGDRHRAVLRAFAASGR
jgi:ABC-type glutathione transport system ATPase component